MYPVLVMERKSGLLDGQALDREAVPGDRRSVVLFPEFQSAKNIGDVLAYTCTVRFFSRHIEMPPSEARCE